MAITRLAALLAMLIARVVFADQTLIHAGSTWKFNDTGMVRLDAGGPIPLSGANNGEIRILKEKHRALWKFLVLADRGASSRHEAVAEAARSYLAVPRTA
jgi:hypothetical protein